MHACISDTDIVALFEVHRYDAHMCTLYVFVNFHSEFQIWKVKVIISKISNSNLTVLNLGGYSLMSIGDV